MSNNVVNFAEKLTKFDEFWTPKIIAEMNDYQFKLAKFKDEFVWHDHADTDEAFIVIKGSMTIKLEAGDVTLNAGEMYGVPKGVKHCPQADETCEVLLIEPKNVVNTGEAGSDLTAENDVWI